MELLREKDAIKWREKILGASQSQAESLHHLQQNLYKVLKTKGKANKQAQRQLLKYLEMSQKAFSSSRSPARNNLYQYRTEKPTIVAP